MTPSFFARRSSSRSTLTIVTVLCIAVLMVALTLVLSACGGGSSIVGKWIGVDGSVGEFTSDGKIVSDDMMGMEVTYVAEDGKLTVNIPGLGTMTYDYEISGDTLTMTDPLTGEKETMTRAD